MNDNNIDTQKVNILTRGKINPSMTAETCIEHLSSKLRLGDEVIKKLLSGKELIIKKHVDIDKAIEIQKRFLACGLEVTIDATRNTESAKTTPYSSHTVQPPASNDVAALHKVNLSTKGKIYPPLTAGECARLLSSKLKIDEGTIKKLLSGDELFIKKDVSFSEAERIRLTFAECGLEIVICETISKNINASMKSNIQDSAPQRESNTENKKQHITISEGVSSAISLIIIAYSFFAFPFTIFCLMIIALCILFHTLKKNKYACSYCAASLTIFACTMFIFSSPHSGIIKNLNSVTQKSYVNDFQQTVELLHKAYSIDKKPDELSKAISEAANKARGVQVTIDFSKSAIKEEIIYSSGSKWEELSESGANMIGYSEDNPVLIVGGFIMGAVGYVGSKIASEAPQEIGRKYTVTAKRNGITYRYTSLSENDVKNRLKSVKFTINSIALTHSEILVVVK